MSLEIKLEQTSLTQIGLLPPNALKFKTVTLEIEPASSLTTALNTIYRNSPLIQGNGKIYNLYSIADSTKALIHSLWMLPHSPYSLQYKVYKTTIMFKHGPVIGVWTPERKAAKIFHNFREDAELKAIVTGMNFNQIGAIFKLPGNKYALLPKLGSECFIEIPKAEKFFATNEEGYDFAILNPNEWILNLRHTLLLFDISRGVYCGYKQLRSSDGELLSSGTKVFLFESGNTITEITVVQRVDKTPALENKKAKKFYVLSQLVKRLDNNVHVSYKDVMGVSNIVKNGMSRVQLEFLLATPKNELVNALYRYALNEMDRLKNSQENIFITTLLGYSQPDSLDIVSICIRVLLHKQKYYKAIELYIALYNQLRIQQQFYVARQLTSKFLGSLPCFEGLQADSMEVLLPVVRTPPRKICGVTLPDFLGLLKGTAVVRCFLLMEMEAYTEVLQIILSGGMKEMKIEMLKRFTSAVKDKISDQQRHNILRLVLNMGITNKDFI